MLYTKWLIFTVQWFLVCLSRTRIYKLPKNVSSCQWERVTVGKTQSIFHCQLLPLSPNFPSLPASWALLSLMLCVNSERMFFFSCTTCFISKENVCFLFVTDLHTKDHILLPYGIVSQRNTVNVCGNTKKRERKRGLKRQEFYHWS